MSFEQFTATAQNDEKGLHFESVGARETQGRQPTKDGGQFDNSEGHTTDDKAASRRKSQNPYFLISFLISYVNYSPRSPQRNT